MEDKIILRYMKGHLMWNDKEMTLEDWWEIFDACLKEIKYYYDKDGS